MRDRLSQLLLLVIAATLGGVVAISLERTLVPRAIQEPEANATPLPTREPPVVVVLPTANSTPAPLATPGDVASEVTALRSQITQQGALLLVLRAERHVARADQALAVNDFAAADRELVAARGALDSAFGLVPEDLKQVIDGQRREVARIRAELQINPEGMSERLRATQDLLLNIIAARPG